MQNKIIQNGYVDHEEPRVGVPPRSKEDDRQNYADYTYSQLHAHGTHEE